MFFGVLKQILFLNMKIGLNLTANADIYRNLFWLYIARVTYPLFILSDPG